MEEQYITRKELREWFERKIASAYEYPAAPYEYTLTLETVKQLMFNPLEGKNIFEEIEEKRLDK